MKKIKLSIAGLMLCGFSYSQSVDSLYQNSMEYDTIVSMISGKIHFEFDYKSNKIIKTIKTSYFEDVTVEIKENQVLYLDLYDNCKCNEYQDMNKYRKIKVYFRNNKFEYYLNSSGDETLEFLGKEVKKITVYKPNTTTTR